MIEIFKAAIERGASDIHVKSGDVVRARILGRLVPITQQRISAEQVKELAARLVPREEDREHIDSVLDYDFSWGLTGLGRFRVNILRQRGSFAVVMRVIPIEIPSFEDLHLPEVLAQISDYERGLILVTGVTGSGKSSTQAAMINWINQRKPVHIVTLENPIEFLHHDIQGSVTQRDIGTDTATFMAGLRAALRQDPDVILIGEMRDKETIDTALKAAETGHLVISTVHTKNAVQTVSRLIAVFEPSEQEMIRVRLADALQAVISQRLIPTKDGRARVPACEIMRLTGTIRDCIRDPERMEEIHDLMEEGRAVYGSQTFDQHLMDLVRADVVDFEVARAAANRPTDFDLKMTTLVGRDSSAIGEPSQDPADDVAGFTRG